MTTAAPAGRRPCYSFFTFTLTVTADAVHLDTVAPADAGPLDQALVGAPA